MNAPRIALAIARCSFASPSCWLVAALLVGQHALPASADPINDGKAAFSQCSMCHSITGAQDSGPHLNGVVGRKSGSVPNFNYSSAMKSTEVVWDTETLDRIPCQSAASRAGHSDAIFGTPGCSQACGPHCVPRDAQGRWKCSDGRTCGTNRCRRWTSCSFLNAECAGAASKAGSCSG